MPLIKSGSREAVSRNISEMVHSGYPQKQAIAAAMSNARRYGKADGGEVASFDQRYPRGIWNGGQGPSIDSAFSGKTMNDVSRTEFALARGLREKAKEYPQYTPSRYDRAAGGGVQSPFGERMAARSLMHQGFLNSAVPGRTDKLPITVGGGAYVLPADHVSALGQGNSLAGANIVNKMFKSGPNGAAMGGLHQAKPTIPHLGRLVKAHGGKVHGQPTEIIAAGGEIVIPPHAIIAKFGDMAKGHKALDQWVINTRKKHIRTLKKLPGPAK